ncbi:hypothetical protein C2E23DRAFT_224982 [Lenzites betulinus]|nr:hypothetical protein C2E23DRAFT_224982 [Lenzites betulinus]
MPKPDDEEGDLEVTPAYLTLFSKHLDVVRGHLAGRIGPEAEPLPASWYAPNAYWTSSEKDLFFRGLAIHSRLRPDLIAEEVKTKTVPDVCVYLALLEQAACDISRRTVHVGQDHTAPDPRISRQDLPAALEVSEDWVKLEESMASTLTNSEPLLQKEVLVQKRAREVHARQKSLRARRGQARTASNERDREGERRRRKEFDVWLEEEQERWAAEDAWSSLDHAGLSALDRMLREDEEGIVLVDRGDDADDGVEDHEASLEIVREVAASFAKPFDSTPVDEVIDPVLLELSRSAEGIPSASKTGPVQGDLESSKPLASSTLATCSQFEPTSPHFPAAPGPPGCQSVPALLPAAIIETPAATFVEGSSNGDVADEDIASMSPTSRRRFQKRLYMRRKRARASGVAVDENSVRLKPGRKPKERPPRKKDVLRAEPAPASSPILGTPLSVASATPQDPPGETEATFFRHTNLSGKTLPYRRHAQFTSIGINTQRLYQEGLGLFHFQSIAKLMQTYSQLHDISEEVASEIAVETFQLLHAIIAQFVAEVMSRAVVSREQERIAKLQTKAWRVRENQTISAIHVKHALALYGADSLDKRSHFAGLLKRLGLDETRDSEEDFENDEHSRLSSPTVPLQSSPGVEVDDEGASGDVEPTETPLEPLASLRMIFPPFVMPVADTLPRDPDEAALMDPSVYMPWPSSSLLAISSEPPLEEDLLPETIDQVALVAELLQDENIEKEDCIRDDAEEKSLWARFSRSTLEGDPAPTEEPGPVEPKIEPPAAAKQVLRKRKRKGKPRGRSASVKPTDEDGAASDVGSDPGEEDQGTEGASQRRVRARKSQSRTKPKGTAYLTEDQLRFTEPDPTGRIKSSVYVLDSD